jgi:hypothetical protein
MILERVSHRLARLGLTFGLAEAVILSLAGVAIAIAVAYYHLG